MKILQALLIAGFAGIMLYGSLGLPDRGKAEAVRDENRSGMNKVDPGQYYVANAYKDTRTPNMVTVVLGDYRSLDTLGEQIVIYTAGLVTILILRRRRKK